MTLESYHAKRKITLEQEVAFLEKDLEKRDLFFILKASFFSAILIFIATFLFNYFIRHKSLVQFLDENGWGKLAFSWLFWFVIEYIFMILLPKRTLNKKKKELRRLNQKEVINPA